MAGKGHVPPALVGDIAGARRGAAQRRENLRAIELDVVGIEARGGQGEPQILERLVAIFRQCAQCAAQRVTVGAEIQLDRLALEPFMERLGIELADAVVERRGGEIGGARLARRILCGAAGEGEVDGDQRDGRLAHQPGLDAARAHDALDGGRGGRSRQRYRRQERYRDRGAANGFGQDARDCVHECFSSGLRLWTR